MTFNINAQVRLLPPTNAAQIAANLRAQLQNITATVNVNVPPQAQRQLTNVNTALNKTRASAKGASDGISDFGKQAALAGKRFFAFTIATTAILRFVGALRDGAKEAIAFQRELIKISQVTGNTIYNLRDLTAEITRLSTTFGTNSSQLLKASRILAQTGLTAKQTEQALQALAKSDLAPTFDDIISTTEGSIAIFRQFGIEANKLEGALGSINAVAGKFAVESSDIIAAVRRTGGAFAAAGGSLEELIALFTSVRATTRESAESIATGFRTIFTRLQRVRTQDFLASLGIDLRNIEGQFVGPLEAVRRLSSALQNLPSTDPRFAQIIEELGGFRQVSKVIPLIQQFDTAERALGVALAGTNSLTQDAETAQQALAVQIQKTREEFIAMIRAFTDSSAFQGTIRLVLLLANALIKVANALEPLAPVLGLLATFSLARLIPGAISGFRSVGGFGFTGLTGRHEGGTVKKFASGGLVPGIGNKDTVPAKLTPGEYVLRKSAVQRIGEENLTHLNTGGPVPAYGGVFLFGDARTRKRGGTQTSGIFGNTLSGSLPAALAERGRPAEKYDLLYQGRPVDQWPLWGKGQVAVKEVKGFLEPDLRGLFAKNVTIRTKAMMRQAAKEISGGVAKIRNQRFVNGIEAIQGHVFEGAMSRLGEPFDYTMSDEDRPMDFPKGIPAALSHAIRNHGQLVGIPVDAKRQETDEAKKSIKRKYIAELADKLTSQSYQGFSLEAKQKPAAPPTGRAGGGSINDPNAILTPGEFVVSKQDAARIGEDRLDFINRTGSIPGMANGGSYGQIFKPTLTGRGVAPGNVGRKKQYYTQLIAYLEKGKQQGLLSSQELQMLTQLRTRVATIQQSRTARFGKRFGFSKGGAFGRIRSYQVGGPVAGGGVAGQFGNIAFALAGLSALTGILKGVNDSFDKMIDIGTSVTAQFGLLYVAMTTAANATGKFQQKIDVAQQRRTNFRADRPELTRRLGTARGRVAKLDRQIAIQSSGGYLPQNVNPRLTAIRNRANQVLQARQVKADLNRTQIKTQAGVIRTQQALAKSAQYTAGVFATLAAVATTAGQRLEEYGRAQLEAGVGGKGAFVAGKVISGAAGGATTGAISGALIGSFVPVIGTAIGAAIGGIAGGLIGGGVVSTKARQEAIDIETVSTLDRSLTVTSRLFGDINKGLTTFELQQGDLLNTITATRRSLNTASATADKDIKANFKSQIDNFEQLFQNIAKSSKSFEDFRTKTGRAFEDFAELLDIPISELNNRYRTQIRNMLEAEKQQLKASKLNEEITANIKYIVNLGRAFSDVSQTMREFETTTGILISFINGGVGSFQVPDVSARVANPEQFFNTREFADIISRNIAQNEALQVTPIGRDATIGADFARQLTDAQVVVDALPGVLLGLRERISEFTPEDAIGKILEQFEDADELVKDSLRNALKKIKGPESKDTKIIERLRTELPQLTEELAKVFEEQNRVAAQIVKVNTEEKNRRLKLVDEINQAYVKEIAIRNKGIDLQQRVEELRAKAAGRPQDLNRLQGLDTQRLTVFGVGTDPRTIGRNLRDAQDQLIEILKKHTKEKLKSDKDLINEQLRLKNVISSSNAALDHLADVGARTAITMQKVDRAQQAATFKQGLLERGAGIETPEEGRQLALELRSARFAAGAGTLDAALPQFRQETLNLFKGLGEARLEVFGGASGTEIFQQLLKNFAQNQLGFSAADAEKFAKAQSSEISRLQAALEAQIKVSEEAYKVQVDIFQNATEALINDLNDSIKTFTNSLQNLVIDQRVQELERLLFGRRGEEAGVKDVQSNLAELVSRFGGIATDPVEREQRTLGIGKSLADIRSIAEALARRDVLGGFTDMAQAVREFQVRIPSATVGGELFPPTPERDTNQLALAIREILQSAQNAADRRELPYEFQLEGSDLVAQIERAVAGFSNAEVARDFRQNLNAALQAQDTVTPEGTVSVRDIVGAIQPALTRTTATLAKEFAELDKRIQAVNTRIEGPDLTREEFAGIASLNIEDLTKRAEEFGKLQAKFDSINIEIGKGLETVGATLTKRLEGLAKVIEDTTNRIAALKSERVTTEQRGGLIRFAQGGIVPGSGNKDNVHALLTPGEVVVPKMRRGGLYDQTRERRRQAYQQAKERRRAAYERNHPAPAAAAPTRDSLFGGIFSSIKSFFGIDKMKEAADAKAKKEAEEKARIARYAANPVNQRNTRNALRGLPLVGGLFKTNEQRRAERLAADAARSRRDLEAKRTAGTLMTPTKMREIADRRTSFSLVNIGLDTGLFGDDSTSTKEFLATYDKFRELPIDEQATKLQAAMATKIEDNRKAAAERGQKALEKGLKVRAKRDEDIRKKYKLQSGAFVPGIGSGDKVRALLEPGEFVLNRNAVKAIGAGTLDQFNKRHSRFQAGGIVRMQEGGGVAQMAMPDFTFFNEIVQKFGNKVDLLAESVNNINGMEIQLVASHKVEILVNGASVLQNIMPEIQNLIVAETNKAINNMIKQKFPDVGQMN